MIALALRGASQEREIIMEATTEITEAIVKDALQYLASVSVFELSRIADCGCPDSATSPGADLLDTVRINLIDHLENNPESAIQVWEIADSSITVYTHPIWEQFVDLCGYNEDHSNGMALGSTMTEQAQYVLCMIAERTIVSLCRLLDLTTDQD